jgi:RNase P subunit RPR2
MSETRQVCCDKCGAIVLEGLTRLSVETGLIRQRDGMHIVDLCADCGEQLRNFVRSRATTAPAATP